MAATEAKYQYPEHLIETYQLEQSLDDPKLRIFDCTVNVTKNPDPEQAQRIPFVYQSGRSNYEQAHIPNAGFIDILDKLSDRSHNLPLMLPSEKQIVDSMSAYGINDDTRVVLYSASETNWATRVWWMLHALGFDNVAILNGGWTKWLKEKRAVSNQACSYVPGQFTLRSRPGAFVDKDDVLAATLDNDALIINALPSPIYKGTSDITFGRKGRISNSSNVPFLALHNPDTECYLSASQLQKKFEEVGVDIAERIIFYCGGGIAASNNAFVLRLLGYENVAVYDGSMLEWGNDASLPMEMG